MTFGAADRRYIVGPSIQIEGQGIIWYPYID